MESIILRILFILAIALWMIGVLFATKKHKKEVIEDDLADPIIAYNPSNILLIIDLQYGFLHDHNRHIVDDTEEFIMTHRFDSVVKSMWVNQENSKYATDLGYTDIPSSQDDSYNSCIEDIGMKVIKRTQYNAYNEQLRSILSPNDTIYVCGLETDACILATCFALFDAGYKFKIIEDLCSTKNPEIHEYAIAIMKRNFGKGSVVSSKDITLSAEVQ